MCMYVCVCVCVCIVLRLLRAPTYSRPRWDIMDPEPRTPKTSVIPRACHNCRIRKTRCNREFPCSNCITSKIPCRPAGRSVAQSQRQSVDRTDSQAGPTIQQLHERLKAVEEALRNQGEQQTIRTTTTPSSTPNTLPALEDDSTLHQFVWDDLPVSYEGSLSFNQQTLLANQIEELKVEDAQTPGVVEELAALRGIYQRHDEWSDKRPKRKTRRPNACPQSLLQLPPSDFVIRLLRTVTEHSVLFIFYAVENRKQVEDLCRRVYFSVEPVTIGEITLLHGCLSVLLKDIDFEARPEFNREETDRYYKLCDSNFKAGVETYEVMAMPTFEHTLILFIAALRAQQDEDLPLQWGVVSAAARHVLALGYNRKARLDAMPPHESPRARRIFWHIYFVDRGFTLSQGKAPIIQDMDVDVDPLEISQRPHRRPWDLMFSAFIELSNLHETSLRLGTGC
ncbi:hypothetical protein CDEST_09823 [Colletotrichum destructivum]|uniref:Zn(2)-C6 fungal-type domain-containing protein n=1 Tax=Colletotrichum destructivum TaxID=34406 RepID=A0AAX4IN61_9PEZI|nr:hypothetical protein CDEST_09823 [Colletotrichum destructivum]